MTSLVACLSSGKGTWTHIYKLIESEEWENIYLITNGFGKENYKPNKPNEKTHIVIVDENKPIEELIKDVKSKLEKEIVDTEVAVNLISGSGKEHMAVIAALVKCGLALRFVYCADNKCLEL